MMADGRMDIMPILYHFDKLTICDHICDYCVRHNIIGENFISFFKDCNGSVLLMISELTRRVKKDLYKKEVIGGKDYIL